jgi:preprotein translocase subunit SecG
MNKKGELTINYIIYLIIAVIVLIVVILIFRTQIADIFSRFGTLVSNIFTPLDGIYGE